MLDIIGTIYTHGEYDADGNELTPPVAIPGWHVNTSQPIEGWDDYRVTPATPLRVYAGHETFLYLFADETGFTVKAIEAGLLTAPEPEQEEV